MVGGQQILATADFVHINVIKRSIDSRDDYSNRKAIIRVYSRRGRLVSRQEKKEQEEIKWRKRQRRSLIETVK